MLDMSWGEIMVIGAVALIVIGPKDLPKALRTIGQMTAKVRRMASEFQTQFNDAMREAELDDVKRQIQGVNDSVTGLNRGFDPAQTIRNELKGAIEGSGNAAPGDPAPTGEQASGSPAADIALPPPAPASLDPEPTIAVAVEPS